jgi:hypothetical protein
MSSKLAFENVNAVSLATAGPPCDEVPSKVGLARTAALLELLSKSAGQRTYAGMKIAVNLTTCGLLESTARSRKWAWRTWGV